MIISFRLISHLIFPFLFAPHLILYFLILIKSYLVSSSIIEAILNMHEFLLFFTNHFRQHSFCSSLSPLKGQRWGSAFPGDFLPEKLDSSASFFSFDHKYREVEGVVYQRQIPDLRVESDHRSSKTNSENLDAEDGEKKDKSCEKKEDCSEKDYLFDDELGLYYCGDFCSKRAAGIQAAALSGIDVANHVLKTLF